MNKNGKCFSDIGWDKLIQILLSKDNKDDLSHILDFLLTNEEKEQLSKRVILTKYLIDQQKSQREISKELGVSICTVTRCSNALKLTRDKDKESFL